ncbi:hypothetical protein ACG04R_16360 [Roseateles sp. BYS78W]|uniref:Uncharacterized protein n=1 Tax=Pelomonas candidula TaxID=3299025 RepID=A0ABW7HEC0_9BURK
MSGIPTDDEALAAAHDGQLDLLGADILSLDSGDTPIEPDAGAPTFDVAEVPVPDFHSKTVLDYAMGSTDFDQRPAYALVKAMRGQAAVSKQMADTAQVVSKATADVREVQGFAERGRDTLAVWVFGEGGLVEQLKGIFSTERELNREAAKGGLLDAAEEVENLVERYGNAKREEFDAHAIQKAAELEREMHRITVTSLQTALQAIVEEKTALVTMTAEYEAKNRYSVRMGVAYGIAGLCAGIAMTLATVLMR